MTRLCAHLGYQFQEFKPLERFEQAAAAGFRAVEWPGAYGHSSAVLRRQLDDHGLQWVQVTLPTGDAAQGEKGLTALPGREAEFDAGLQRAIDYALVLQARWVHPMSGVVAWDAPGVQDTYLRNLQRTVEQAQAHGLGTLIEVIGEGTVPGYAMSRYERARTLIDELRRRVPGANVKLLFDSYHAQTVGQDMLALARQWMPDIGHVQIADVPGRHEPGTGMLDFDALFALLDEAGYDGWAGCEYVPATTTLDGLPLLGRYLWR